MSRLGRFIRSFWKLPGVCPYCKGLNVYNDMEVNSDHGMYKQLQIKMICDDCGKGFIAPYEFKGEL